MDSPLIDIMTSAGTTSTDSPASRLVRAAVRDLEAYGSESVSIERILTESATSYLTLFQEFGGRDGLLDSARLALVAKRTSHSIEVITSTLHNVSTYEDLFTTLMALTTAFQDETFKENRLMRSAVIGSVLHRPELRSALADIQNEMTNNLAALIESIIVSGGFRCVVSPRALAVFVQAFTAGQVIDEIDHTPTPRDEWLLTIESALRGLILPPIEHIVETESL